MVEQNNDNAKQADEDFPMEEARKLFEGLPRGTSFKEAIEMSREEDEEDAGKQSDYTAEYPGQYRS